MYVCMPNALIVTRWRQWRVSIYPQVVLQQPDDDGSAHELRITVISASERERERKLHAHALPRPWQPKLLYLSAW